MLLTLKNDESDPIDYDYIENSVYPMHDTLCSSLAESETISSSDHDLQGIIFIYLAPCAALCMSYMSTLVSSWMF